MLFLFQVVAREVANSAHVATATVILNIIDTNDNSPVFEVSSYVFGIVENSPIGTSIGIIMVWNVLRRVTRVN